MKRSVRALFGGIIEKTEDPELILQQTIRDMRDRVPELVRLYLDGQLDLDAFISHRMPLDEVNEAFELMERQDGIRSVLTFG